MKSMTCRELGGPCDLALTASTWDEMVMTMTKHVMSNHPETAKAMEKMHNEDPKKWGKGDEAQVGHEAGDLASRCTIEIVAKRAVIVLVAFGVLLGFGMPLRRPCCSFMELSSGVSSPDCCSEPGCCRSEKSDSAQIVLPAKSAPLFLAATGTKVSLSILRFIAMCAVILLAGCASTVAHSPPLSSLGLSTRFSILRV